MLAGIASPPDPMTGTLVDFPKLQRIARELAPAYPTAEPFPHAVIEDFLPDDSLRRALGAWPLLDGLSGVRRLTLQDARGRTVQAHKAGFSDELQLAPELRQLIHELNSGPFLQCLESLTGIRGLIPDPHLRGGGLHEYAPGAVLAVHADFHRHAELALDRRLNLLLFLNERWDPAWGGALELWTRDMGRCVRRVPPLANTCVVFSTTSHSYHGMPDPLACPPGVTRRSLAFYYYSNGRPAHEISDPKAIDDPHETLWQERPAERS